MRIFPQSVFVNVSLKLRCQNLPQHPMLIFDRKLPQRNISMIFPQTFLISFSKAVKHFFQQFICPTVLANMQIYLFRIAAFTQLPLMQGIKTVTLHIAHKLAMVAAIQNNALGQLVKSLIRTISVHFLGIISLRNDNLYFLRQNTIANLPQKASFLRRTVCLSVLVNHKHDFIMISSFGNFDCPGMRQFLNCPDINITVNLKIRIHISVNAFQIPHNLFASLFFLPSRSSLSHTLVVINNFHNLKKIIG